jgi:predicted tellurium resistance membrane protein TerC
VSDKYWVILTGGILGIVMMRLAAKLFIKLLDAFPAFETTAYLLILWIGAKLTLEGLEIGDFHDKSSPWSLAFWGLMVVSIAYGFFAKPKSAAAAPTTRPAA